MCVHASLAIPCGVITALAVALKGSAAWTVRQPSSFGTARVHLAQRATYSGDVRAKLGPLLLYALSTALQDITACVLREQTT